MAKQSAKTNGNGKVCITDYGSVPPNFSNATPGYLIDELGTIRAMAKKLEKWEGWFKEAIKGRRSTFQSNAITGDSLYDGLIVDGEQVRIDADAVREHFKDDPETLAKLTKTIPMVTIKVTPKTSSNGK